MWYPYSTLTLLQSTLHVESIRLPPQLLQHLIMPLRPLKESHMSHPFTSIPLPRLQLSIQHLPMMKRQHPILRPMHNNNAFSPHPITNLFQLLRTLVMPSCCYGLHHEAFALEGFGIGALGDFLRRETTEVRGVGEVLSVFPCIAAEGWEAVWCFSCWNGGAVWRIEPWIWKHVVRCVLDRSIERFWNKEVDSVPQILNKWHSTLDACYSGAEGERVDAGWDEVCEFLGDHAAHGDTDDVELAVLGPAEVVDELQQVLCHLGCGVATPWLVTTADATVIDDEGGVFVALFVAESHSLTLP